MEDDWTWPESVRKKLHPRRGGVKAIVRKQATPGAAFKKIAKHYAGNLEREVGMVATLPVDDPMREEMLGPVGRTPPPPRSAEEEARRLKSVEPKVSWVPLKATIAHPFVDYWVGAHDVSFAMEVVGRGVHDVTLLERLRWHLCVAPEDAYDAALAIARDLWDQGLDAIGEARDELMRHVYLAYLFPGQPEWAHHLVPFVPQTFEKRLVLHSVSNADLAAPLLADLPRIHSSYWKDDQLVSFVEAAGVAAAAPIAHLLRSADAAQKTRISAEALSLIPSDEAFGVLVEHVDDSKVAPYVTEAALRWPQRARRLLDGAPSTEATNRLLRLLG